MAGSPQHTEAYTISGIAPEHVPAQKTSKVAQWFQKAHRNVEEDGMLAAVIGYIGLLGFLIAWLGIHKSHPTDFSAYHLKQGFGNVLLSILLSVGIGAIRAILNLIPGMAWLNSIIFTLLTLWPTINLVIGIINAASGKQVPLPLIGKFFENKFNFIK